MTPGSLPLEAQGKFTPPGRTSRCELWVGMWVGQESYVSSAEMHIIILVDPYCSSSIFAPTEKSEIPAAALRKLFFFT